ncbi:MAG: transglycosylase SLT domain-containing protein [candidate division WOR-3 bacterium]|nr:MAG: transglycosylase SLT domain-containing protein [candidate division WOR-3 bacterium]
MKRYFTIILIGIMAVLLGLSTWQMVKLHSNLHEKIEAMNLVISRYEAKALFVDNHVSIVKEYTGSEITARRILSAVYENSLQYDLQADLILAVIKVESEFNPRAHSSAGAIGLMQIMPVTGIYVGRSLGYSIKNEDDLYNIERNIKIGVVFLKECIDRLGEQRGLGYYYAGRHAQHYNRYTIKIAAAKELWTTDVSSLTYNVR